MNQVVEEPAPVVPSSTSSAAPAVAGDQAAVAPPVVEQLDQQDRVQSAIDAAAALARYPPVHSLQGRRVDQFVQPLQPASHDEDEDEEFDVLNAPQHYPQQG